MRAGAGKKDDGREEKVAAAPAAEGASSSSDGEGAGTAATGLPMANLVRLMRQVIPKGVKISSRAKDLTHDCAIEFVGFLAGEASELARAQHRRTISPEDFTRSLQALGFDDYVRPMSTYISRYREQATSPAGYSGGFARRPPPRATAAPCVSDEETRSRVPPHGEHGDGWRTSVNTPAPGGHGYDYTSPDNM